MKLSLAKLKNSEEVLIKLSKSELPVALAYKLAKVMKPISSELVELEDFRKKLVMKYGVQQEDGMITVPPENIEKFVEELNPLLNEEVDLPFEKINGSSLPETLTLTPLEITLLEDFINFEQ